MDALVVFVPLLPFIAAVIIGMGQLSGLLNGEASEGKTAIIATWAISMSCLLALVLLTADLTQENTGSMQIGQWLSSDSLNISVNFITTGFNVVLAALFSILLLIIMRF
jgi:NADH:ubiquinone oxidoreductase subunit 5 (subunit L)/multisubunit Na+/H+ antiporter MnhA subunit